jgi:hypothetical protein
MLAGLALALVSGSASAQEPPVARPHPRADDRVELRPIVGWGSSPGTLSHWLGGGGVYLHVPHLAIGVDFLAFAPCDAEGGAAPSYPLNETAWATSLNVAYSPIRSHVRDDGRARTLMPYGLLGLGAISTRPVSVVDPAMRTFDYKPELTLDAALGTHVLLSRTVGLDVELRDTLYSEQLENALVASGPADMPSNPTSPSNPDTWYGSNRLTNFIALQLGVSFFAGGR